MTAATSGERARPSPAEASAEREAASTVDFVLAVFGVSKDGGGDVPRDEFDAARAYVIRSLAKAALIKAEGR